jgi:hypothetical protein
MRLSFYRIATLASIALILAGSAAAPARARESEPLALGVWVPPVPWDFTELDDYTRLVGVAPAIISWYQGWVYNDDPGKVRFDPAKMDAIVARGATPLLTWEPWDYTLDRSRPQPAYAPRAIAVGEHDPFVRQWARAAAAWGRPFYLRFAHEMNGDWYPWGTAPGNPNGNSPADFVAAWRHVHDLFRQEGATNVRWVWSPNYHYPGLAPLAELYPGDAYVDWVALDAYNRGTGLTGSGWAELAALIRPSYDELTALTDKQLMLAEIGSSEIGGDKAAWIRQALLADLPARFPRIHAVIWFHEHEQAVADWRVDTSPAALEAFRQVATSPVYQGRLP